MSQHDSFPARGIWAAAMTPATGDFAPDLGLFKDNAAYLLDNGCDGLAVLGTTGEANSQSMAQRMSLIEHAMGNFPAEKLMIGAGCCALDDSVTLAKTILGGGVKDLLVLPPWYYAPSDDGLFAYFSALLDKIGDSSVRIYLYHFPKMTGVPFSLDLIARFREAYPDNIVGIKDSSGDWSNMEAMLDRFPGFAVFPGSEVYLLQGLEKGSAGCISASFNALSSLAGEVYAAWKAGDAATASQRQDRLTAQRKAIQTQPLVPALKMLAARRSGNANYLNLFPPLQPLGAEAKGSLLDALSAAGFDTADSAIAADD